MGIDRIIHKRQATGEEKPAGYYKPYDLNARPGIDVCSECFETVERPEDRRAPLHGGHIGVCCLHFPEDRHIEYRKFIESGKNSLRGASLDGACLWYADLEGASLWHADLRGANLWSANLRSAALGSAAMRGANLRYADLEGAKLKKADLEEANLAEVNLQGANLREARLRGANLRKASLRNANLDDADLEGANLEYTDLRGADLSQTSISEASLYGVRQTPYTIWVMLGDAALWLWELLSRFKWLTRWARWFRKLYPVRILLCFAVAVARKTDREADRRSRSVWHSLREPAEALLLIFRAFMSDRPTRIPVTKWAGVNGVDTVKTDSLTRRYIKDVAYVEDFSKQHPHLAFCWRWTCFYGQSFSLWALWCVAIALCFGLLYWQCGFLATETHPNNFLTSAYFSIVTFTTLGFGDVRPISGAAQVWVVIEVVLGYIGLGGLISIFANKIARRA